MKSILRGKRGKGVQAFTECVPLLPFSIPKLVIREASVPVRAVDRPEKSGSGSLGAGPPVAPAAGVSK